MKTHVRCSPSPRGSGLVGLCALSAAVALAVAEKPDEKPDPAIVRAKIEALGLRDESLPHGQHPLTWLSKRREAVFDQLIAALSDPRRRVAEGCLSALAGTARRQELLAALLTITADENHAIYDRAAWALRDFGDDPRARQRLVAAAGDVGHFPEARHRAQLAAAGGKPVEAVRLLTGILAGKSEYEKLQAVQQLEAIDHSFALSALETASKDRCWLVAAKAHLALGRRDPKRHGLTADQVRFLQTAGRGAKAGRDYFEKRRRELAKLDRKQIRPFVMQMLGGGDYRAQPDAAGILVIWRDREALPQIRKALRAERGWRAARLVAAYVAIEGTDASIDEAIGMIGEGGLLRADEALREVCRTDMPAERKLAVLRRVHGAIRRTQPHTVPQALRFVEGDVAALLKPLMDEETDLRALAAFAKRAGADEKRRFAGPLIDALKRVAAAGRTSAATSARLAVAAEQILDACAAGAVGGAGKPADELLASARESVRLAAAHVSARLGGDRKRAMTVLYRDLAGDHADYRRRASAYLANIPCLDAADRRAREKVLLACLGKPSEDYALRLLPACGGAAAVKALRPLLAGDDVTRAVHAAWVLAQLPDKAARTEALRRLAVYAMFHHTMYQQGSGIDFEVAKGLQFHQVTGRLNPAAYRNRPAERVQIPPKLLAGFDLDEAEQRFAVRVYRRLQRTRPVAWLVEWLWPLGGRPNETYLPLLKVIAAEDATLKAAFVKGRKVAHFPIRKAAAEHVARITGRPARYVGLAEEPLDSAAWPPRPYDDQPRRVAALLLDRIEAARLAEGPSTDAQWRVTGAYNDLLNRLTDEEQFGDGLKQALLAEADRRRIAKRLRAARLRLWRDVSE